MIYFSKNIASVIGIEEAIIIRYLENRMEDTKEIRDSKKWVTATYKEIESDLKIFKTRGIERLLNKLIKERYIFRELYAGVYSYTFTEKLIVRNYNKELHCFTYDSFIYLGLNYAIMINTENVGYNEYIPKTIINRFKKRKKT